MSPESDLERAALAILFQMVTNSTTTSNLSEDQIVDKAWKYAEFYMVERTKRREVAEAMKELEK
jgi:hypothetical protein